MVEKSTLKKLFERSYIVIALVLLYTPIFLMIVFSFFNTSSFSFSKGMSFNAYIQLFTSSNASTLGQAFKNTLLIAAISSVTATILGSFASIGIFAMSKRSRKIVENVNQLPVINSEIVIAVALMLFFITFRFPDGYTRLLLGHISFCTPYVVLSVMPRLMQMDSNIYEAALDLGAKPLRAIVSVIIPIILPGILSGFAMAFTISVDDFIITQLNKGTTSGIETLSTYIYSSQHTAGGLKPYWFAAFSIIIVVVVGALLLINLRRYKKTPSKRAENSR
ncbi:MAG: ABC transporter permease subunit [Christensenellaceae bacterium]|jgi:spermidine/putrescine transport system permease protein|nr:ABC transporter permease subunit [Christensenellaceae bacterium]